MRRVGLCVLLAVSIPAVVVAEDALRWTRERVAAAAIQEQARAITEHEKEAQEIVTGLIMASEDATKVMDERIKAVLLMAAVADDAAVDYCLVRVAVELPRRNFVVASEQTGFAYRDALVRMKWTMVPRWVAHVTERELTDNECRHLAYALTFACGKKYAGAIVESAAENAVGAARRNLKRIESGLDQERE